MVAVTHWGEAFFLFLFLVREVTLIPFTLLKLVIISVSLAEEEER